MKLNLKSKLMLCALVLMSAGLSANERRNRQQRLHPVVGAAAVVAAVYALSHGLVEVPFADAPTIRPGTYCFAATDVPGRVLPAGSIKVDKTDIGRSCDQSLFDELKEGLDSF